jgi:hypothetical protein
VDDLADAVKHPTGNDHHAPLFLFFPTGFLTKSGHQWRWV